MHPFYDVICLAVALALEIVHCPYLRTFIDPRVNVAAFTTVL
jgi:hypothetical protein